MAESGMPSRPTSELRAYVGYDPRLHLPYEVIKHSMATRASLPLEVVPLNQSQLREAKIYWRERNPLDITEFTLTRFLTLYLAKFKGWAMFVDSDFLYTGDVAELFALADDRFAAMCVKHDYAGRETTVMDGQVRTTYPRLNWSSMVLYNCSHPKNKILTPDFVNTQAGEYLQKLMWLEDEDIGALPQTWNFLVGHCSLPEDDPATAPKAIHFTEGGPWYDRWKDCQFSDLWFHEKEAFEHSQQVQDEMQQELVKLMEKNGLVSSTNGMEGQLPAAPNAPEKVIASNPAAENVLETPTQA